MRSELPDSSSRKGAMSKTKYQKKREVPPALPARPAAEGGCPLRPGLKPVIDLQQVFAVEDPLAARRQDDAAAQLPAAS
jgi:hypothetical protein